MNDPIVEEVRKYRKEHSEKFDYNLDAIFEDIRKHQSKYKDRVVKLPGKESGKART